jgi:molybdate transport system ATP-binding protein
VSAEGVQVDARVTVRGFVLRARFAVSPGVTAIVGPSASGKTLLLDLLAGLVRADGAAGGDGEARDGGGAFVTLDGRVLDGPSGFVAPHLRPTGYAAQHASLWPHRTVRAHVEPFAADAARAARLIDRLGLGALVERYPARLSGGERQRVALARALARKPRLLLLDEPLTALDRHARSALLAVLQEEAAGALVLFVTHDLAEARAVSERAILVEAGEARSGELPLD